MNKLLKILISIISVLYLFYLNLEKDNIKLFICDFLNIFLILILVLLIYPINKDFSILLFILFLYTKLLFKDFLV